MTDETLATLCGLYEERGILTERYEWIDKTVYGYPKESLRQIVKKLDLIRQAIKQIEEK